MGEVRKDYILDRYVIINPKRGERPHQFKDKKAAKGKKDYFAPGNERETPEEIGRLDGDEGWRMRWFENKFAAVKPEGVSEIKTDNDFFTYSDSYGKHEVIVETPDDRQLADLSVEEIKDVLQAYSDRIEEIEKDEKIKYVSVFKNHGPKGGTSILHSHSQIIAVNHMPVEIREKLNAVKRYDSCPYCSVLNIEKESDRRCFENEKFVAFCPYASRFNYEIWILPKEHLLRLKDLDLGELASIMKRCLEKIASMGVSYNFSVQYAPRGEEMHFHIEIMPRIADWAGFELGTGTVINSVSPEDAAAFYRE